MITFLLLGIIYLAFISLGLPDSLLGVTWPTMQVEWGMAVDSIGLVSMILIGSTIISSFMSSRIIEKIGTGKTTLISCALTATALIGISFAPSFIWLMLLVIPLGLGGGAVDAALNNYVALHFEAHHMNWLHSFWGVGATVGPLIMARSILSSGSWQLGYKAVGFIQLGLALLLFLALPLWAKHKSMSLTKDASFQESKKRNTQTKEKFYHIKGLPFALITVLMYCSVEHGIGLWGSTYLVQAKALSVETAATWIGLYYGGITIGRFISGFISFKLSNTQLMRLGMVIALLGTGLVLIASMLSITRLGFIIIGIGLAPIFPAMLHATPKRFGKENSQRIIGIQMGFAYIGSAFLSPLWGPVLKYSSISNLPLLITLSILLLIVASERVIHLTKEV